MNVSSKIANVQCSFVISIKRAAPLPSVRRTRDVHHPEPVVIGIASGLADNDHFIAGFDAFACHTFLAQLSSSAPLDGPGLRDALLIRDLDVQERMRVAE